MKRSQILLSSLSAVLVIALFYFLLFQPAQEEVAELEIQIAAELQQQATLNQEIARLRAVREQAPEVEAELAAAEAIVPRDAALPSALRQLQIAADESGIVMQSITTSRPNQLPDALEGLSSVDVSVQLVGGYFQVVDFLRRVEDPTITPRGLEWVSANVARTDEYPDLNVSLTGALYALVTVPPPPEPDVSLETEAELDDDPDAIEGSETDTDGEDVS
jgi:Tfp pilus assembly protein PilO